MARSKPRSKPKPRPRPEPKPERKSTEKGWTQNALVSGVVPAVVAGLISFLVAHQQSDDSAKQALETQQIQEAGQLETAAGNLYQTTTSVYNFQMKCAGANLNWQQCANIAPDFNSYSAAVTSFGPASLDVKDQQASRLAASMGSAAAKMISVTSAAAGETQWNTMLNEYAALEGRCAQIIQGQVS